MFTLLWTHYGDKKDQRVMQRSNFLDKMEHMQFTKFLEITISVTIMHKASYFKAKKEFSKVKSLFFIFKFLNGLTSPYAIPNIYTWVLSGTTSQNRLDGQRWPLPSSFLNDNLITITITDFGNANFQRIALFALTFCFGNL